MPQAVSRQPKAVGELPRDAVRAPLGLDGSRIVYYVTGIQVQVEECGTLLFLSGVKARHDKMVELVTRMMELKKQQARAPKKQSPSARQLLGQKLAITDQQIDALVYELYGLTEEEIRIVEGET
jgi:hypothetical protein